LLREALELLGAVAPQTAQLEVHQRVCTGFGIAQILLERGELLARPLRFGLVRAQLLEQPIALVLQPCKLFLELRSVPVQLQQALFMLRRGPAGETHSQRVESIGDTHWRKPMSSRPRRYLTARETESKAKVIASALTDRDARDYVTRFRVRARVSDVLDFGEAVTALDAVVEPLVEHHVAKPPIAERAGQLGAHRLQ